MKSLKLGVLILSVGLFSYSCNGDRPQKNGLVKEGQYQDAHGKTPKTDTGGATLPSSGQKVEDSAEYKPVGGKNNE